MNQDKYVFTQVIEFLNRSKFNRIVAKYNGDRYIKTYSFWNQLLTLIFGQLGRCSSLRDCVITLQAHCAKLYHLGIGKNVTRSNLSKANEQRDYHIFEEFAYYMIAEARRKRATKVFDLDGNVYAFDSTTIDLCLSLFEWAKFRSNIMYCQTARYALQVTTSKMTILSYYVLSAIGTRRTNESYCF